MLDVLFLVAFVVLPVLALWFTRSVTWVVVALALGFGIAGNAVQSLISLGMDWSVRGLQWLSVGVMLAVVAFAWLRRGHGRRLRHQLVVSVLPAVLIGLFLILMRVMAPGAPGPLTAVGYLANHPEAEDNAKWLHLTAQLADGRPLEFNGYAGGPLLLLLAVVAALISVLSLIMLGGINEVAVAANTVVGTQFLLIALIPFAFAPFAEKRLALRSGTRTLIPAPLVWSAILVAFLATSVVTSFGHLSLQFILVILILWSSVFVTGGSRRMRLLMTLTIVTTAAVWLPFNILGIVLLVAAFIWTVRMRDWRGLVVSLIVLAAVWDALITSTLFLLGIDVHVAESSEGGTVSGFQTAVAEQVETATSLFTAPGAVEKIGPLLAGLALATVLFAVWLLVGGSRAERRAWTRFLPIAILGGYLVLIQVGDAITTAGAPHYGGHKLAFAFAIMALASTLPIAIAGLEPAARGMTPVRWFAVGGVVVILTVDTILPRAISALSPQLWPAVDASAPAYWAVAEVKPQAEQPISSLPIACFFTPPQSAVPSALPLGQQSYNCTRLLLGMNGLERKGSAILSWLQTDWLSNSSEWDSFYPLLVEKSPGLTGRSVVLMNPSYGISGLSQWGAVLERNVPASPVTP